MLNTIKDLFVNPAKYRKFWVAFATFLVTLLTLALGPGPWLTAFTTFLGSLGVFAAPNGSDL